MEIALLLLLLSTWKTLCVRINIKLRRRRGEGGGGGGWGGERRKRNVLNIEHKSTRLCMCVDCRINGKHYSGDDQKTLVDSFLVSFFGFDFCFYFMFLCVQINWKISTTIWHEKFIFPQFWKPERNTSLTSIQLNDVYKKRTFCPFLTSL